MGEVYRARDTRLDRDVAIKALPAAVGSDRERLARLEREAKSVAALNHPNIVTLYSLEEAGGVHFLTMELVDGEDLDRLIAPGGLPISRVLDLVLPIADALAAAHEKGIVHRDLKPGNVMVTREGRVKVLDFGLARLARGEASSDVGSEAETRERPLTAAGATLGTVPYMAPEQVRGEEVDSRCDLFAIGVLLYELVTGSRPFRGSASAEVSAAILRDAPEPVTQRRADVPADLARVVHRCLEKSPDHRFQTAKDLRSELDRIRLELERKVQSPLAAGPPSARRTPSIAVVPFAPLGPGGEDAYLADGLSEEIITDLSRLKDLHVISRASCFRLRGLPAVEAGRELGVQFVLDGSLRRAGQALRINAQLVNVADGRAVWGERFDTVMDNLFSVQERLSRSIVEMLRGTISPADSAGLSDRPIRDVAVYECYLRARRELWQLSPAAFERARALLDEGLARAGDNILLLATLGELWISAHEFGLIPDEQPLLEAERLALRAVRLDSEAPATLFLSGLVHFKRGRMQEAIDALGRVLALEPGNADAVTWLDAACFISGRVDVAAALAARLGSMDPLTPMSIAHDGFVDLYAGRLEAAEPKYRRWFERDQENPFAHYCWGMVLAMQGRAVEAADAFENLTHMVPNHVLDMLGSFLRHSLRGDGQAALAAVNPTLEQAVRLSTYLAPHMAAGYALLNARDRALEWLEIAFANGFAAWRLLEASRWYPGLDADPRFRGLLTRMRKHSESIRV
jgi:serine/threonine protein kinase/tetratricopeptide (TPR) repeat protein